MNILQVKLINKSTALISRPRWQALLIWVVFLVPLLPRKLRSQICSSFLLLSKPKTETQTISETSTTELQSPIIPAKTEPQTISASKTGFESPKLPTIPVISKTEDDGLDTEKDAEKEESSEEAMDVRHDQKAPDTANSNQIEDEKNMDIAEGIEVLEDKEPHPSNTSNIRKALQTVASVLWPKSTKGHFLDQAKIKTQNP